MRAAKRGLLHKRILAVLGAQAVVLSATLSWADGTPNHVRDVKVRATDASTGATEIEVVGTTAPDLQRARRERRQAIARRHLERGRRRGVKEALTSQVGVVGGVLTQGFKTEAGQMTRLSVSLAEAGHLPRSCRGHVAQGARSSPSLTTTGAASAADVKAAGGDAPAAVVADAELADVRFEKGKGGADRVLITTTAVPAYSLGDHAGRPRAARAEEDAAPEEPREDDGPRVAAQPAQDGQRVLRALERVDDHRDRPRGHGAGLDRRRRQVDHLVLRRRRSSAPAARRRRSQERHRRARARRGRAARRSRRRSIGGATT